MLTLGEPYTHSLGPLQVGVCGLVHIEGGMWTYFRFVLAG
jgi:hypothetical protein